MSTIPDTLSSRHPTVASQPVTNPHPDRNGRPHPVAGGPTPDRILQFAWGYAPTLILETALKFRLFDHLDGGSKTSEELAAATGATQRGVRAIADALVSLDFLRREGDRYVLTPESATFLVSTRPAFHGTFFQHTVRQLIPRWLQLSEVVRTGQPAVALNDHHDGAAFFAEFVESLFPLSYAAARTLGEHLRLADVDRPVSVLDLGAGSGVWGIALAQSSPRVRMHAVDWPEVLDVTRKVVGRVGLADRLTTSAGDLLEADFGRDHTVATLGHILHSEGPDRSKKLLGRILAALAPGGTLAIAEFVPNEERTGPPNALIFAVNMLVNTTDGDAFTFNEIAAWLKEVGFVNPRELPAPGPSPLILANKPA
jgi:SAM-dependent methyltransferase